MRIALAQVFGAERQRDRVGQPAHDSSLAMSMSNDCWVAFRMPSWKRVGLLPMSFSKARLTLFSVAYETRLPP